MKTTEQQLRHYYLPFIKGTKPITEKIINRFKNDLIKLKQYENKTN